jgi:hypothetical protein
MVVAMRTLIKIVRDRDQSVLEQDVADVADANAIGRAISDLLARIHTDHPHADLGNLTIKIGSGSSKPAACPESRNTGTESQTPGLPGQTITVGSSAVGS